MRGYCGWVRVSGIGWWWDGGEVWRGGRENVLLRGIRLCGSADPGYHVLVDLRRTKWDVKKKKKGEGNGEGTKKHTVPQTPHAAIFTYAPPL